jgi:squalene-hopene/tetraprenyl-beta-curcumene cyclase
LRNSVRADGSWPIDSDLATWVTTLSINALALRRMSISEEERESLLAWLLGQQYHTVHPFTGAAPGGWAWTDRAGGVPDADDTAGALRALLHLAPDEVRVRDAATSGISWLLDLQNRDGGMPTFCRGWGALPFDRSSPDLTAHALAAWSAWRSRIPTALGSRVEAAIRRAIRYLGESQRKDGAWIPLWFGNEAAPEEENPTYGTARVLEALAALPRSEFVEFMTGRGRRWLQSAQNSDGGWGGAPGAPSSIEETSLALGALSQIDPETPCLDRGAEWLVERTNCGRETPAAPIGMYFAKLWYYEELYPLIFAVSGLSRYLAASCRDSVNHKIHNAAFGRNPFTAKARRRKDSKNDALPR